MAQATTTSMQERIEGLQKKRDHLIQGGGAERIAKQHEQGKLTARERIEKLADNGSFLEVGLFATHRQTQFGMAGKELAADDFDVPAPTLGCPPPVHSVPAPNDLDVSEHGVIENLRVHRVVSRVHDAHVAEFESSAIRQQDQRSRELGAFVHARLCLAALPERSWLH